MNNLYSGLTYFVFQDNYEAGKFIKGYDRTGHGDNIATVFVLPKGLYDPSSLDTPTITCIRVKTVIFFVISWH